MPDHYLTRMLLSQGVPRRIWGSHPRRQPGGDRRPGDLAALRRALAPVPGHPVAALAGADLPHRLRRAHPLGPATADTLYDEIAARLAEPDFRPRALFAKFNIEVLATTESPLDDLGQHAKLAADGWGGPGGRVVTTFRPDDVVDMEFEGWSTNVDRLGERAGEDTGTYTGYLAALRADAPRSSPPGRRPPTTATHRAHPGPHARGGPAAVRPGSARRADAADAEAFRAHMLVEFARMSLDDGLVMQLHPAPCATTTAGCTPGTAATSAATSRRPPSTCTRSPCCWRATATTPAEGGALHARRDTFTRELAPSRADTPRCCSARPGGSWTRRRCCAGSGRRSPKRRLLQHHRVRRRHPGVLLHPRTPRRGRRVDAGFLARLVAEDRLPMDEAAETIVDLAYRLPKRVFNFGGQAQ
ncbi:glucuronate isomerase [Micromonospora sp. M12]